MVNIGLPSLKSLTKALRKLQAANIPHYAWSDPDLPYGMTAITTAPIYGEQRRALENYRVYAPGVLMASTSASKAEGGGSIPPGSAILGGCAEASARP
jgi:hypothetical protein